MVGVIVLTMINIKHWSPVDMPLDNAYKLYSTNFFFDAFKNICITIFTIQFWQSRCAKILRATLYRVGKLKSWVQCTYQFNHNCMLGLLKIMYHVIFLLFSRCCPKLGNFSQPSPHHSLWAHRNPELMTTLAENCSGS
jgi:hypothetical protein